MTAQLSRTSDQPRKATKQKARKCRICRQEYAPRGPMQRVCSPDCAVNLAVLERNKRELTEKRASRKEIKARKEKVKKPSEWAADAQAEFNRYIRARDLEAGYGCISCGTKNQGIQYAAGHYRTVKAAPHLRFNEDNVHLQCNMNCNSAKAGNVVEYRIALVKRIGLARVEALECNNTLKRYSVEELKSIRDTYRAKLRELKAKT